MDYNTEIINISKISEGIFIGDRIAGTNLDVILRFKITHMINSAGSEIINQFESIGIKYLVINWNENPNQSLFDSKDEISNRIVSFIDESLKNGEGLLIHSVRGQDRVCIVVIIYLMKKYNWSLRKCIEFLHSKKQDIDIPNFFLEQLFKFNIRLDNINKGKKKENWDDEDNFFDLDEKIMRNTYVNGLPSDKNVISENKIKKKKVGWVDNNPYGRNDYLFSCNLKKDLFLMKDIKPVINHLKMKPSKSCVKNKNINSKREFVSFKDNNNNNRNDNRNKIYNIQQIKQNEIYNVQYDNNINQFTFGLDSDILEQINNLAIPKSNNNLNNINNNNINNSNKEFNNSIKQNNYKQYSENTNIQNKQEQNQKRINNFVKNNNNIENIQNQKPPNTYDINQNINMKNFINLSEQFNDKNNYKNYSLIKEQNNFPNENNKVIFTHNYEQIVTNNINNYFIQNQESINNKKNPNQDNINIFNKDYNNPSVITNISSSTIKNQLNNYIKPISSNQKNNSLRNSGTLSNNNKNNQIKKPMNFNNYFYENSENPSLNRFKVIDYSSENEQNNNMIKNNMNQPQKNIYNPNNINNNYNNQNQFRQQFIGGINNYNPKKNSNHNSNKKNQNNINNNLYNNNSKQPINNYNPSLLRKAKTPLFTRQNNMNNGPIKIQNNQIKKPTTPDNINRKKIRSPNIKINYNHYGTNINPNNSINKKSNSKSKNNEIIKRPSTAPQKDKSNNKYLIKGKNNNNYNHMGQTMKRASSLKIQSHNLNENINKTQKFNYAKYRAPSPMIKSKSLSLEPIKKNGFK